jgi:hypothetical protein
MDPNAQRLLEADIAQDALQIDKDNGVIRNVKLCSRFSKNNREYAPSALKDLHKLYELLPIRIDHDEKGYLKTVGSVADVKLNHIDWELRGDISLNRGHPAYDQIMEDAEHRPHLLKLSHEIPARGYQASKKGEQLVVNRVHKVDCFAIVTNGGVNSSLFEAAEEDDDVEIKSLAELKAAMPALYEELEKAIRDDVAKDHDERIKLIQERDDALQKLHEAEEQLAAIDAEKQLEARKGSILRKAKEMKRLCSEDLLEALLAVDDEKVERILQFSPALKEDGTEEQPPEKPTQRSGLAKRPKGYETKADWYRAKLS